MNRLLVAFCMSVALFASCARAEEYRLQVGDALELFVAGLQLQRKMIVDTDGLVSVPLLGEVQASGKTVAELASYIRREIPTKYLNVRTPDGKDQMTVIEPQEISLYISEYVPIYINGDVSRPGEQKFRPGLTVRQAIALSGGLDIVRFRVDNPALTSLDYEDQLSTKWMDWERDRARQPYLLRALNRAPNASPSFGLKSPLPKASRDQIIKTETDRLRAAADSFERELQAKDRQISTIEANIKVLDDLKKTNDEGLKYDAAESARISDLFNKGTLPATRLAEARRIVLLSSTGSLQAGVAGETARKELAQAKLDREKLASERNEKLLSDLKDADESVSKLQSGIASLSEKLVYTSALRSQLLGSGATTPQIMLVRRSAGRAQTSAADLDAILSPGDVVEVRLNINPDSRAVAN